MLGSQGGVRGQLQPQPPSSPVPQTSPQQPGVLGALEVGGTDLLRVSSVWPFLISLGSSNSQQGTPTFPNLGESCARPGAATLTSEAPIHIRRWARVGQTWRSWPSPCPTLRAPRPHPCRCCSQVRLPTASTILPPMVLCSLDSVKPLVSSRCTETSSSRGPEGPCSC